MSHPQQIRFVQKIQSALYSQGATSVLEIGSYDVNGTIRTIFKDSNIYIGIDLIPGKGVDIVCSGADYGPQVDSDRYDLVISCECFEHNPYWADTLRNMISMASSDGLIVFSCATTGRLEHGTRRTSELDSPGSSAIGWQYYKNLTKRMVYLNVPEIFSLKCHRFFVNRSCSDLYFVGANKYSTLNTTDLDRFFSELGECERVYRDMEESRRSILEKLSRRFIYAMSVVLPDKHFQDFAIAYYKYNRVIKKFLIRFLPL